MKILVASRNPKKLAELQRVLTARDVHGIELVSLRDVPSFPEQPEDGRTFADNALIKARDAVANTGLVTIADDSGLAVEEMFGMPGVLSARWGGEHGNDEANNRLLLAQMQDVPDERRGAGFVSVCAVVVPAQIMQQAKERGFSLSDGVLADAHVPVSEPLASGEFVARGVWKGRLLREPRGEHGFGYDPLFVPEEEDQRVSGSVAADRAQPRSSAELSAEEKDALSHRGRALAQLVPLLRILGHM